MNAKITGTPGKDMFLVIECMTNEGFREVKREIEVPIGSLRDIDAIIHAHNECNLKMQEEEKKRAITKDIYNRLLCTAVELEDLTKMLYKCFHRKNDPFLDVELNRILKDIKNNSEGISREQDNL
jgi:hypothetical protein